MADRITLIRRDKIHRPRQKEHRRIAPLKTMLRYGQDWGDRQKMGLLVVEGVVADAATAAMVVVVVLVGMVVMVRLVLWMEVVMIFS